jgi:hypothetical protein
MRRADVLAIVDDQFHAIRKSLDLQLRRTGELQAQLDQIHKLVKRLAQRALVLDANRKLTNPGLSEDQRGLPRKL